MKSVLIGIIFFASFLCVQLAFADERPTSLKDSIIKSIKLNPNTVATDELLEAIRFGTLAAQASEYPSGQIYCSSNLSSGTSWRSDSIRSSTSSEGTGCGVSASVTLFDGGARKARIRSVQASEQATRNSFNTADSLIRNTRGSLANSTLNSFLRLARLRNQIVFYRNLKIVLLNFRKFSSDRNLENGIIDNQTEIEELTQEELLAIDSYHYFVKLDPAENLESFDQTIESLAVPLTAEMAIELALEKGPEVLRRNSEVEVATWNLKAIKAERGPRVSLNASISANRYDDLGRRNSDFRSRNASLGITASIPLSFGLSYQVKSAQMLLKAKQSERRAAIESATHDIISTYQELENAKTSYANLRKNYQDQVAFINELNQKVISGQTTDLDITKMLSAVRTLVGRFEQLNHKQQFIINQLFGIHQVTGLLFTQFAPQSVNP